MFILQEPNQEQEVTLPFQNNVPEADRIKWKVRAISCRQAIEYEKEFDRVLKLATVAELMAGLGDLIRRVAVDWSNIVGADQQPLPFTEESLNLFGQAVKMRIASELPNAAAWGGDAEKKESGSP